MAADDFLTGLDLFEAVMRSAGQSQSLTDDYAFDATMAIMQEYYSLIGHAQWFFAKHHTPAVLATVARDQVVVSSIAGSTVTLSAPLTPSRQGRKFYVEANQSFYRISAHTDNTPVLTLDAVYVEPQLAGRGIIYQDEYPLLNTVLMPWTPMRIRGQWERDLDFKGEDEFRAMYGWNSSSAISIPEAWTLLHQNDQEQKIIQLAPWTSQPINIEYEYTRVPDKLTFDGVPSTDTPRIPKEYRWVLYERALSKMYATKDDTLSDRAWKRAQAGIEEMVEKYTSSHTQNRLFLRPRHGLGVG